MERGAWKVQIKKGKHDSERVKNRGEGGGEGAARSCSKSVGARDTNAREKGLHWSVKSPNGDREGGEEREKERRQGLEAWGWRRREEGEERKRRWHPLAMEEEVHYS